MGQRRWSVLLPHLDSLNAQSRAKRAKPICSSRSFDTRIRANSPAFNDTCVNKPRSLQESPCRSQSVSTKRMSSGPTWDRDAHTPRSSDIRTFLGRWDLVRAMINSTIPAVAAAACLSDMRYIFPLPTRNTIEPFLRVLLSRTTESTARIKVRGILLLTLIAVLITSACIRAVGRRERNRERNRDRDRYGSRSWCRW